MSLLILGAAELGTAVATALATHPARSATPITITMRPSSLHHPSPTKSAQLARFCDLAIKPLALDIEALSAPDLAETFREYTTIIGCTGMAGSPGLQRKLAEAILSAKVERYIPWQFGVDYDVIGPNAGGGLFSSQCEVRDLLRGEQNKGMRWVIVSTGVFMGFLFDPVFGVYDAAGPTVRAFGSWGNEVTATGVGDIGRVVGVVVFEESGVWEGGEGRGRVVHVAGDTVTFGELAGVVEEVLGREVGREVWREVWSTEELKRRVEEEPGQQIHRYRVIWAEGRGVAWDVGTSFNGKRGMEMTGVREWAVKNLRA